MDARAQQGSRLEATFTKSRHANGSENHWYYYYYVETHQHLYFAILLYSYYYYQTLQSF